MAGWLLLCGKRISGRRGWVNGARGGRPNGRLAGPKTGRNDDPDSQERSRRNARNCGWKPVKTNILGRQEAPEGWKRRKMVQNENFSRKTRNFTKTGRDGGLILFSCIAPVFLLSRGFWGLDRRLAGPKMSAEAKNAEKWLATGLGGLKTEDFRRKTEILRPQCRFWAGKRENRGFPGRKRAQRA